MRSCFDCEDEDVVVWADGVARLFVDCVCVLVLSLFKQVTSDLLLQSYVDGETSTLWTGGAGGGGQRAASNLVSASNAGAATGSAQNACSVACGRDGAPSSVLCRVSCCACLFITTHEAARMIAVASPPPLIARNTVKSSSRREKGARVWADLGKWYVWHMYRTCIAYVSHTCTTARRRVFNRMGVCGGSRRRAHTAGAHQECARPAGRGSSDSCCRVGVSCRGHLCCCLVCPPSPTHARKVFIAP